MKMFTLMIGFATLISLNTLASTRATSLDCYDASAKDQEVAASLTIDLNLAKGEITTGDGGELGAAYSAEPTKDTASYAAFKIQDDSQDGEQPNEIKIEKSLLTTAGKQGKVWLAPGIVGGVFTCKSN